MVRWTLVCFSNPLRSLRHRLGLRTGSSPLAPPSLFGNEQRAIGKATAKTHGHGPRAWTCIHSCNDFLCFASDSLVYPSCASSKNKSTWKDGVLMDWCYGSVHPLSPDMNLAFAFYTLFLCSHTAKLAALRSISCSLKKRV